MEGSSERVFYYDPTRPIAAYDRDDWGPYLVTVTDGATPAQLDEIAELGARHDRNHTYDRNVYVYRLRTERLSRVKALAFTTGVAPLQPGDRYQRERVAEATGRVEVVIDLFTGGSDARQQAVATLIGRWGGEVRVAARDTLRGVVDAALVAKIAAISDVRWIELDQTQVRQDAQ